MGRKGDKPKEFWCTICDKGYIHASNLSAHVTKKHAEAQAIRKIERKLVKCNPKKEIGLPSLDLDRCFVDSKYLNDYLVTLNYDTLVDLCLKEKTFDILDLVYKDQMSYCDDKVTYMKEQDLVTVDLTDDFCSKLFDSVIVSVLNHLSSGIHPCFDDRTYVDRYLQIKYDYHREKKNQITNIVRTSMPVLFYAKIKS